MREELKEINIEKNIMEKISAGKIKMRPKIYFVIGAIFAFLGIAASFVISAFMFGLLRFVLRSPGQGKMAGYRLEYLQSEFPWWLMLVAIIGLILGIVLIRKYNFAYKIKSIYLVLGIVLAVVLAGVFLDATGLNDKLYQRGYMRQFMIEKYGENIPLKQGRWNK